MAEGYAGATCGSASWTRPKKPRFFWGVRHELTAIIYGNIVTILGKIMENYRILLGQNKIIKFYWKIMKFYGKIDGKINEAAAFS
jgi:hypothetical protein